MDKRRAMRGTDAAKVITVIRTTSLIGEGTEKAPGAISVSVLGLKGKTISEP